MLEYLYPEKLYTMLRIRTPHGFGLIDPLDFSPMPKNPVIANFFREIGWAEELGLGGRNLNRYGIIYGGQAPELEEDGVFRTTVYVPSLKADEKKRATTEATTEATKETLFLLAFKGAMARRDLQEAMGLKSSEHLRK